MVEIVNRQSSIVNRQSPLTFWALVTLASAAFAPCVLVPVWEDYRAIKLAERLEVRAVEHMRREVGRQERLLDALRTDPGVVARVALRDLAYTRPAESSVPVHTVAVAQASGEAISRPLSAVSRPPEPLNPQTLLRGWLSIDMSHLDVFAARSTRTMVMCLSGGLLLAAFLIFPPNRQCRQVAAGREPSSGSRYNADPGV